MAYSTDNSTNTISVTNFGAIGNGIVDDTKAFQRAIDSLYPKGGGRIFVPKGTYLTSGYINVTGHNISLCGQEGLSVITTRPSGDYHKFNISGGSGIGLYGLSINAGRTSGREAPQEGAINVYSAPYFEIANCSIEHSESFLILVRANTYCGSIRDNVFNDYQTAIYSHSNDISGIAPNRLTIADNRFLSSWGTNEGYGQDYFGGIKLQNSSFGYTPANWPRVVVPGVSAGHIISNNTFSGSSQMGIELWGFISESVVSDNYIENAAFGISIAASSYDITVDNNTVKGCAYIGIEAADARNVTISNNVVDGSNPSLNAYTPIQSGRTDFGIILNGVNYRDNHYNVIGNTVRDCCVANIQSYVSYYNNIVGNTLTSNVKDGPLPKMYDCSASSFVNFSNNQMYCDSGNYFVFIDANSVNVTGITISNNDFAGNVDQWGILYYNNGSLTTNSTAVLIENNRTNDVKYCRYGMISYANAPTYAIHRNNFGQSGALGYYIPDYEVPAGATPYSTDALYNGYQFHTIATLSLTGAINSTSGAWVKIYSRDMGSIHVPRFAIDFSKDDPPYSFDGKKDALEFTVAKCPYGGDGNIYVHPQANYYPGVTNFVEQIAVDNPSADSVVDVWVKLTSGSSLLSGVQVYFYGDASTIAGPTLQYEQPSFHSSAIHLGLNQSNRNNLKVTRGVSMGTGADEIYSPLSGYLSTSAIYSAKNYRMDLSGLPPAISSAGASGRLTLDFNNPGLQTVLITGGTVISGTNYYPGAALTVRLFATTPSQALAWAPWTFIGTTTPTGLATSKTAILSLQCFDTTDTGVIAAYAVQP